MTDTGPDGDLIARLAAHKAIGNVPRAELEWLVAHGTLEAHAKAAPGAVGKILFAAGAGIPEFIQTSGRRHVLP